MLIVDIIMGMLLYVAKSSKRFWVKFEHLLILRRLLETYPQ